ncbi:MAG: extensin family protein [Pseudomonadota bacterium]
MKYLPTLQMLPLLAGAMVLAGCGGIIPAGSGTSATTANTSTQTSTRQPTRIASMPQQISSRPGDRTCLAQLSAAGAQFNPLPDSYAAPGCSQLGTVQLAALSGDGSSFGISNIGPVQCHIANTFSAWARFGVDRAARQILDSPLKRIETMGSYACRNIAGSNRRSAHARAEAIDVSAFVLEDGRRIVLKSDWEGGTPAEREFLRVVHRSACKRFGTVLGPDYNAAHKDHFHLEGTGAKFCR